MNKTQFWTLSGALLASTAMAGVANAGSVGRVTSIGTAFSTTALKISSTLFSATPTVANAVIFGNGTTGTAFAVSFTNSLPVNSKFNATVSLTGANFATSNATPSVQVLLRNATGSYVLTVSSACNVTPLQDKILIGNCVVTSEQLSVALGTGGISTATGYFMGGLQISAVTFNNASGLAGGATPIQLSGSVSDQAQGTLIENITAGSLVTASAPLSVAVTAGTAGVANASVTPFVFSRLANGAADAGLSLTLATVLITATGVLGTDLISVAGVSNGTVSISLAVTATSTVLSNTAAATSVTVTGNASSIVVTSAAFSGGAVTVNLSPSILSFAASIAVSVNFSGTAAIPQTAAGTLAVAFGANSATGHVVAAGTTSGATAAIVAGGLQSEVNAFQASGNTAFPSFLRIHNNGAATSGVLVSVFNDSTSSGAQMGASFTTALIAPNSTLQLTAAQIEAGAGITTTTGQYTVKVAGGIVGYVQHILFNSADGSFSDLSGFRNQNNANGGAP